MATKLGKIIADFNTTLAVKTAAAGTTGTLLGFTDDDGVALPAGTYYLTVDGGNSLKEYWQATLGSNGALTAISSVSRQGVITSGSVREHRVGATVILSDFAYILFMMDLIAGTTNLNASVPLGYDGTATITTNNQLATKAYVDAAATAGAPDATPTAKGIAKTSVAPVSSTSPIAVGDNDPRVPTQNENDALVGTTGAPSSSNKYVTETDTNLTNNIKTTGDQSVAGIKTFTSIPVLPASDPTTSNQAVRKSYVDNLAAVVSSTVTLPETNGFGQNYVLHYRKCGKVYFGLWIEFNSNIGGGINPYPDSTTVNKIAGAIGVTASGTMYTSQSSGFGSQSSGNGNEIKQWNGSAWVDAFNSLGVNQYTTIFLAGFLAS